jgi:hypothetical protein
MAPPLPLKKDWGVEFKIKSVLIFKFESFLGVSFFPFFLINFLGGFYFLI